MEVEKTIINPKRRIVDDLKIRNKDNRDDIAVKQSAVFIDRDGTIIVDKVETRKKEDLEFFADIDSLKKIHDAGLLLVIITNQSGIGKGHYSEDEMTQFNDFMIDELRKKGINIDALYYCPHRTEDNCQCKKPKDGMIRRAALELNICLENSYLIGDQNSDIMAGVNAGIKKCYAVPTGLYPHNKSKQFEINQNLKEVTIVCTSLGDAINKIMKSHFSANDD